MNQVLVAELLAEDALLRELHAQLDHALSTGEAGSIEKIQTQRLKHTNLRKLILAEMDKAEMELYEMQRDHSFAYE